MGKTENMAYLLDHIFYLTPEAPLAINNTGKEFFTGKCSRGCAERLTTQRAKIVRIVEGRKQMHLVICERYSERIVCTQPQGKKTGFAPWGYVLTVLF